MMRKLKFAAAVFLMQAWFATAAVAAEFIVTRAEWPEYANGPNVLAVPAVRATLRDFDEDGARILIRHPGGDAGILWARALHDWLVVFGVPADALELQPGVGAEERLVVEVLGE